MKNLNVALMIALFSGGLAVAQSQDLGTANEDLVWVTMGEDAFGLLNQNTGILRGLATPESFGSSGGVVITRLPARALSQISAFFHTEVNRCSGFIVHESQEEAEAALFNASRGNYAILPSDFVIDQQALVNQLLPDVTEVEILSTITHLSTAYNNRYYLNASGEQAALWIRDQWQTHAGSRSDVTVTTYSHSGYNQPSVILTIDGASLPDEVVVLGAHLDSIQSGANNSDPATLAPGADDDASGIATLTEVIRVLMANNFVPDRTVKFMGYAAEEVGLRGSGDIAADHAAAGTEVVAVMQLDMTDYNGSVEDIVLIDDFTNVDLTSFAIDLVTTYQPSLSWTYTTCGYACSDHASWTNNGFPAAFPFEARFGQHNQNIHTVNDTVATLGNSAAHAVKFGKLALSFAVEIGLADICDNDGVCETGEDCSSCAADCPSFPLGGSTCGNGLCEAGDGEDCTNCAADCNGQQSGKPANRFCCGFGGDGPVGCGDSACTTGGFSCTETPVGGSGSTCCGDLICEGPEDSSNCALDCGAPPMCGDSTCDPGEDACSCAADCGTPPASEAGLCSDGIDNDCGGGIDCSDADCGGDPVCQTVDCSTIGNKSACNSEPTCRWNNKDKVCMPN